MIEDIGGAAGDMDPGGHIEKDKGRRPVGTTLLVVLNTTLALAAVLTLAFTAYQLQKVQAEIDTQARAVRLESRGTIASQYRSITDREFERPDLYLQLFEFPQGRLRERGWVEYSLRQLAPSLPTDLIRTVADLDTVIWTPNTRGTTPEDVDRLRLVTLHAESYLDFLIDVNGYETAGVITEAQANEWYAILRYPGFSCHPAWLYTVYQADLVGYTPPRLARKIHDVVVEDRDLCEIVARQFYPEILNKAWGQR